WAEQGQPWRTQPEIDRERQRLLSRHRYNITHDIVQGHYPFKDVRLDRADIEWLLASHASDGGHGPVDPSEVDARRGLDLRGADVRAVDLSGLPLTRLRGGLDASEWFYLDHQVEQGQLTAAQRQEIIERAAVRLDGAKLGHSHLERAELGGAHLEGA